MVQSSPRTVLVYDITPLVFNKLRDKHDQTLSCPCSIILVPHKMFVSNQLTLHPACSSTFVTQQWIDALYLPNASRYRPMDFRTIAHAQVTERFVVRLVGREGHW